MEGQIRGSSRGWSEWRGESSLMKASSQLRLVVGAPGGKGERSLADWRNTNVSVRLEEWVWGRSWDTEGRSREAY